MRTTTLTIFIIFAAFFQTIERSTASPMMGRSGPSRSSRSQQQTSDAPNVNELTSQLSQLAISQELSSWRGSDEDDCAPTFGIPGLVVPLGAAIIHGGSHIGVIEAWGRVRPNSLYGQQYAIVARFYEQHPVARVIGMGAWLASVSAYDDHCNARGELSRRALAEATYLRQQEINAEHGIITPEPPRLGISLPRGVRYNVDTNTVQHQENEFEPQGMRVILPPQMDHEAAPRRRSSRRMQGYQHQEIELESQGSRVNQASQSVHQATPRVLSNSQMAALRARRRASGLRYPGES